MNDRLAARVKAKNRANEIANRLEIEFKEIFRPFVGKKILLQTGGFIKSINETLKKYNFPENKVFRIWKTDTTYSLNFRISAAEVENYNCSSCSAESRISIGKLDGNILTAIEETNHPQKTDFSAEEIQRLRDLVRQKESEVNQIRNQYYGFGENDQGGVFC